MTEESIDADGSIETEATPDGGQTGAYTIRLELADEPGELLNALSPIADNGGNLLSIFHERGNITPRGRIPVEVDLECHPEQFETIVDALREAGMNVVQAVREEYGEELTVLLVGHVIDTDLSDTLERIQSTADASVTDLALSAPEGTEDVSSARLRIATSADRTEDALAAVREIAEEKELHVIEPQLETGGDA